MEKRKYGRLYNVTVAVVFLYLLLFRLGMGILSCYVSAKSKKWVNRGFMHGPFLPIYGSGAIVVLIATIPVKDNLVLVYLLGMISATILEYCTGACMEKMFHVRYWDYSEHKFNLNGHICLGVSLGWGVFSVLMIRFIHKPINYLVMLLPLTAVDIISTIMTVGIAVDFTQSFNEAMDLKAVLMKLGESNEQIRHLEKRIEVTAAFASDKRETLSQVTVEKKDAVKRRFEENLEQRRQQKMARYAKLEEQLKAYFLDKGTDTVEQKKYMDILNQEREKMRMRTNKDYRSLSRILKRNPSAVSKKYREELREIKDMMELKNKEK